MTCSSKNAGNPGQSGCERHGLTLSSAHRPFPYKRRLKAHQRFFLLSCAAIGVGAHPVARGGGAAELLQETGAAPRDELVVQLEALADASQEISVGGRPGPHCPRPSLLLANAGQGYRTPRPGCNAHAGGGHDRNRCKALRRDGGHLRHPLLH
jgi:hypothetical protein